MELLTRQQAEQTWFEPDPRAQFDDLLEALGLYKDISTEYGLNQTVHHQWRFGDPHKKSDEPDRHDYEIKVVNGVEVAPGPNWHSLYRWVVSQAAEFLAFQTVYLITDNRDLLADTVASTPGLSHWPMVAAWWKERIRYVGPYGEHTTVVFVPISADTGLDKGHATTTWPPYQAAKVAQCWELCGHWRAGTASRCYGQFWGWGRLWWVRTAESTPNWARGREKRQLLSHCPFVLWFNGQEGNP